MHATPAFVGKITPAHFTVYWDEDDGTTVRWLSTTISAGSVWPAEIADDIANAMTTESSFSGGGLTYFSEFKVDTGTVLFECSGGGIRWLHSQWDSGKILTGGEMDDLGNPLSDGQMGRNHLGFVQDGGYPSFANGVESPFPVAHYWTPNACPARDNLRILESETVQQISLDGSVVHYDFTGWIHDSSQSKAWQSYLNQTRELQFLYLEDEVKSAFIENFWLPYAKSGGVFRYYPNRLDPNTFELYILQPQDLMRASFGERETRLLQWNGSLNLRRVAE